MKRVNLLFSWIFLTRFWIRILNQLFEHSKKIPIVKRKRLGQGIVLVLVLALLNFLLQILNLPSLQENITKSNSFFFFIYCGIILISLPFVLYQKENKKIWLQIRIGLFSLGALTITWNIHFLTTNISYYLLLAYAEEVLKFSTAHINSEKTDIKSISKLLLCSILIWFSFSLAENLLAIWVYLIQWKTMSSSFLLGRGLISSFIHIVATGTIACLLMKDKKKTILQLFLSLWAGFMIHATYNLSIYFKQEWIGIILAIWAFFSLSYLLYHLDELYLTWKKNNTI